jgi:hypothetical protein
VKGSKRQPSKPSKTKPTQKAPVAKEKASSKPSKPPQKNTYTLTPKNLTVRIGGQVKTISSSHANFKKVLGLVKSKHWTDAAKFLDIKGMIKSAVKGATKILEKAKGKAGAKKDTRMHEKVISDIKEGKVQDYTKFYERIEANPDKHIVDQLFNFLHYIKAPIQEDGTFLAYKYVNGNFTDVHTGKFDNSPRKTVSMPREQCNSDPNQTCSTGLHVGSQEYTQGMGDKRIVVQVDPADVVSVPIDYNGQKMRVCKYKVLREFNRNNE